MTEVIDDVVVDDVLAIELDDWGINGVEMTVTVAVCDLGLNFDRSSVLLHVTKLTASVRIISLSISMMMTWFSALSQDIPEATCASKISNGIVSFVFKSMLCVKKIQLKSSLGSPSSFSSVKKVSNSSGSLKSKRLLIYSGVSVVARERQKRRAMTERRILAMKSDK